MLINKLELARLVSFGELTKLDGWVGVRKGARSLRKLRLAVFLRSLRERR